MKLFSGAQQVLDLPAGSPFETLSATEARAAFDASWPLTQAPTEAAIPVPYDRGLGWRGKSAPQDARVILYLHGGGWVVGSPQSHAAICQRLANACDAVVLAPDYRLAPEHPFPAAAEDTVAGLAALPSAATRLGFDPARIVVAGDSAGGNLAAVAALAAARDPRMPQPKAQVLYYPNTSAGQTHDSYVRFGDGYGLTAQTMRWFRNAYLPDPAQFDDWRVSPLLADLDGVAPAHVVLAGADILYDEGRAYADRLITAGVDVQADLWPDRLHGFLSMCRYDPAALDAIVATAAFLDTRAV